MLAKTLKRIAVNKPAMTAMGITNPKRDYNLSLMDRVKEKFH